MHMSCALAGYMHTNAMVAIWLITPLSSALLGTNTTKDTTAIALNDRATLAFSVVNAPTASRQELDVACSFASLVYAVCAAKSICEHSIRNQTFYTHHRNVVQVTSSRRFAHELRIRSARPQS